ncbi:hypothetical protein [Fodinicola acaciae]|uniref:hypothetical protein n=1 Tax=Fodinicola acaciae TaxID=2681555 RepID=UPI0013D4A896|nr:hypothetical protein [Fodinicola acaciae]
MRNRQQRRQTATDLFQLTIDMMDIIRYLDRIDDGGAGLRRYTGPARSLVRSADERLTARAWAEDSIWDRRRWRWGRTLVIFAGFQVAGQRLLPGVLGSLVLVAVAFVVDVALVRVETRRQSRRLQRTPTESPYDSRILRNLQRGRALGRTADTRALQRENALLAAERADLLSKALPLLAESHRLAAARRPVDLADDVRFASRQLQGAAALATEIAGELKEKPDVPRQRPQPERP